MPSYGDPVRIAGKSGYYSRVYDPDTKRRSWASLKADTLAVAKERLKTLRLEDAMGPQRRAAKTASELVFRDVVATWLAEKDGRVCRSHHRNRKLAAEGFWYPILGSKRLAEITVDHIGKYTRQRKAGTIRAKEGKAVRAISATTANGDLRALRQFFNWCMRRGYLVMNPTMGIDMFAGETRRRVRELTQEEEERLLRACSAPYMVEKIGKRNTGSRAGGRTTKEKSEWEQQATPPSYLRPAVVVALGCGFRRGTIVRLRWRHLDMKAGEWRIPAEITKTRTDHNVPCPAHVLEALKKYRAGRLADEGMKRVAPDVRIFGLTDDGSTFSGAFDTAVERAELDGLTLHDCRRIYTTRLARAGVDAGTAMALSGHKSIATVLKYYRSIAPSELRAAVGKLEAAQASGTAENTLAPGGAIG